ncbi:MAG: MBL fold metallo-hydrolase [Ponticaulis sp.]|nr:MBL fold metallo-hydrolase [Ponticaulis sp.]|tara:strand:- start:7975 stop:9339 length:1365 start_codon:yes stop_codon:yes gene_type:complete
MIFKSFKTPGLAHFSYLIGAGGDAVVIDPQLDAEQYLLAAQSEGVRIAYIFETHRNEDFITGARHLAELTGAKVFHGPNPAGEIRHAELVEEGFEVQAGTLRLRVLETPGHTDDSISIAVYDEDYPEGAVGVFTGDALFVGDVGRTDFYPERAEEVSAALYDSLRKLVNLGDQVLLWPAHGAGSVCGSGMAAREFSTIGHERLNNPRLQLSKDEFVSAKVNEHHYQPPYFELMERLNLEGGAGCGPAAALPTLSLSALKGNEPDVLLDVRAAESHLAAHISGSLALPVSMIAAFGGWFLKAEDRIGLIADSTEQAREAYRHLCRIGFANVTGVVTGLLPMAASGADTDFIATADTDAIANRIAQKADHWKLLDVRSIEEFKSGHIEGAEHAYVGEILQNPAKYVSEKGVTVMCGSGARASLAASALKAAGQKGPDVYIGSMGAWTAAGKPVAKD